MHEHGLQIHTQGLSPVRLYLSAANQSLHAVRVDYSSGVHLPILHKNDFCAPFCYDYLRTFDLHQLTLLCISAHSLPGCHPQSYKNRVIFPAHAYQGGSLASRVSDSVEQLNHVRSASQVLLKANHGLKRQGTSKFDRG